MPDYSTNCPSMSSIDLNLLVLRYPNVERAAVFYSRLGLSFKKHRHGSGPEHFASEMSGFVFELYPESGSAPSTLGTRIGFKVASVDAVIAALRDFPNAVIAPPCDSEWGRRAVVTDPGGHRVELTEARDLPSA
jgi:predicted enzyme related to lactoylglutathione lyase